MRGRYLIPALVATAAVAACVTSTANAYAEHPSGSPGSNPDRWTQTTSNAEQTSATAMTP